MLVCREPCDLHVTALPLHLYFRLAQPSIFHKFVSIECESPRPPPQFASRLLNNSSLLRLRPVFFLRALVSGSRVTVCLTGNETGDVPDGAAADRRPAQPRLLWDGRPIRTSLRVKYKPDGEEDLGLQDNMFISTTFRPCFCRLGHTLPSGIDQ